MRQSQFFTLLFVLFMGCNDVNVRQQRAEEARRQQTASELKAIGETMHNAPASETVADPVATDTDALDNTESKSDSRVQ